MEIIRPSLLLSVPRSTLLGAAAIGLCSFGQPVSAAELVLQKVPPLTVEQAPAYPENLARYPLGAQVEITPKSDPAAEAALLAGDPTAGYSLPNGSTTVLVSLGKVENIDSISFLDQGAKGHLTIAASNAKVPADSPQWNNIAEQDLTGDAVKIKVGPSEAKYLRLTFNINESGRVADLGIYSTPTVAAFTMPHSRKGESKSESVAMVSYNVTDLHARARAVYVSSGEDVKQANNMIDDQPGTVYNFAPPDAAPTAVVDLEKLPSCAASQPCIPRVTERSIFTSCKRCPAARKPRQLGASNWTRQRFPACSASVLSVIRAPDVPRLISRKRPVVIFC